MDISGLKILIAEDNQINVLLMRKLLAKWDIAPDFALNGLEAMEAFKANHYDLILMDIHMPFLDGYEVTRLIRTDADEKKSRVPIIALTASIAADVRQKINDAAMDDFILKPFNPEELRLKLAEIATVKN
jgi:CheY-like chemotaxis protein